MTLNHAGKKNLTKNSNEATVRVKQQQSYSQQQGRLTFFLVPCLSVVMPSSDNISAISLVFIPQLFATFF